MSTVLASLDRRTLLYTGLASAVGYFFSPLLKKTRADDGDANNLPSLFADGIIQDGKVYRLARNPKQGSEYCITYGVREKKGTELSDAHEVAVYDLDRMNDSLTSDASNVAMFQSQLHSLQLVRQYVISCSYFYSKFLEFPVQCLKSQSDRACCCADIAVVIA